VKHPLSTLVATALVALAAGCGGGSSQPDTLGVAASMGSEPTGPATSQPPSTSTEPTPPPAGRPLRVTFIGDSVPDSITYVPAARARLRHGMKVRLDLKVCRRLVTPSCSFQGTTPDTALEAVHRYGRRLGDVLIVDVGYNDWSGTYRRDMRKVVQAANRAGVTGIVWVTLRQSRSVYRWTNHVIRNEAQRWPDVVVADWDAKSAGHPWFGADGLHLNDRGAIRLAQFLRPYVFQAAGVSPAS
jgi:hypothetical protein